MKYFLRILGFVLIAAAAYGGFRWNRQRTEVKPVTVGRTPGKVAPPLKVSAVSVVPESFAETVTSTGTLRAEEGVELQAEINGKIVAINFTEGARVRKGELLVKLNDAELRATLGRASSRLNLAKHREERITRLFKDGIANQDEHDAVLNEMAVQESEVAVINAQIEKTEIRAPFDGIVGLRFVSEGAFVNAAARIATLQGVDNLKVDFSVPERYAGRVDKGTRVTFTVAGGAERYSGQVVATDPRIDTGTRTLLARAVCPNPNGRLRPGAFANVELTLSQLEGAILVPSVAVVPGITDKNIFVVAEGKAVRRVVETGTRTETAVQILSGLKSGDVVITSGIQQMRAGLLVEPVFTKAGEPPARRYATNGSAGPGTKLAPVAASIPTSPGGTESNQKNPSGTSGAH